MKRDEAKSLGYRQLTESYYLPGEQWMIDGATKNLDSGKIPWVLVPREDKDGTVHENTVTLWRINHRVCGTRETEI